MDLAGEDHEPLQPGEADQHQAVVVAGVAGGEDAAHGEQVVADGTVRRLGDEHQFVPRSTPSLAARPRPISAPASAAGDR